MCGSNQELTYASGIIRSPIPELDGRFSEERCSWYLQAGENKAIELEIVTINIPFVITDEFYLGCINGIGDALEVIVTVYICHSRNL